MCLSPDYTQDEIDSILIEMMLSLASFAYCYDYNQKESI
jgi:hypothetical protein